MKLIKLEETYKHKNSENCIATEYDFHDKDIDFATATIDGRYPETGYCVNREVKELIFVISGSGFLHKENEKIAFKKGDAILIDKNEPYYWDAKCTVGMACSPAWRPEQHQFIRSKND